MAYYMLHISPSYARYARAGNEGKFMKADIVEEREHMLL